MQAAATSCSCSRVARPEARRSAPCASQRSYAVPLTPVFKSGAVQLRCNAVQRMQRYLLHNLLSSAITSHQQRHWRCEGSSDLSKLQYMDSGRRLQDAGDAGSHSRSAQPQAQNLWILTPTSGLRRSVKLRAYVLREILVWALSSEHPVNTSRKPSGCARLVPCTADILRQDSDAAGSRYADVWIRQLLQPAARRRCLIPASHLRCGAIQVALQQCLRQP